VVDDNGVVMAIDFDEQERRRRAIEEARETLADLAMFDDVLAVRELLPPVEDPVTKWRREGEARARAFEQESERRQAEEARTVREQRQAAEMPEAWAAEIGEAVAKYVVDYVGRKIGKLERRLDALERKQQRSVDDGDVVDLPSPLIRKVRINAA
jgi:hypothetical protein